MLRGLGRFLREPGFRRLAAEAAMPLPRAHLAIGRRPFPQAIGFGAVPLGPNSDTDVELVSKTVASVARRMPFRALCFEQGLTVQRMLRRRGVPAVLHYGVDPRGELSAHVWISLDGRTVHGGETAARYTEVARWP